MAASATLSSYVGSTAPRVVQKSRSSGLPLQRGRVLRVRCQSEQEKQPLDKSATVTPPPQPTPSPAPKPAAKVSTKFSDVLAFSGPAPERINGRLAMLGFVSAMAVEVARGDDLFAQLMNGGLPWFVGTAAVFSVASLIPLFKGQNVQSKTDGFMNANAELWNGRFAMMGLVALAFTEYLKGGPLV
ncbi:early light-induced protein 2, chloroplastic-like isoform X1 [Typha angustifolia]|uniref:early light-induced protein 2, chloroplastic-like isoform X1 n=1 Tax=Typha angustifolia TaxID=59011 RepID=UPI003C303512